MFDGKAFGDQMVEVVRSYVDQATAPLLKRIEAQEGEIALLRAQAPIAGPPKRDGVSITLNEVAPLGAEAVGNALRAVPPPKDGKDGAPVDPSLVESLVADRVDLAMKAMPTLVETAVEAAVSALPPPKDGVDGQDGPAPDPAALEQLVSAGIEKALKSIPPARDGQDGKDGVSIAGALIDRDGALVVTLSNGETRSLGVVVGRDGKDGERGPPGRDALRVQDIDLTLEPDGRTLLITLDDGDVSFAAEIGIPTMIYRGVFKDGDAYERGDTVTWAGSLWHCDLPTKDRPGEGSDAWTLAVKRGRDAKPAVL